MQIPPTQALKDQYLGSDNIRKKTLRRASESPRIISVLLFRTPATPSDGSCAEVYRILFTYALTVVGQKLGTS